MLFLKERYTLVYYLRNVHRESKRRHFISLLLWYKGKCQHLIKLMISYATNKQVWLNSTSNQKLYLKISEAIAIVSLVLLSTTFSNKWLTILVSSFEVTLNSIIHHIMMATCIGHKCVTIYIISHTTHSQMHMTCFLIFPILYR